MLTYTLKKTPGHPLYEQLYQSIRDDIAAGRLPAGSRLPSKRVLAAHLGVSVVTVESAYAQLLAEGYAETRGYDAAQCQTNWPETESLDSPAAGNRT